MAKKNLAKYRAKRDFKKTPEPSGKGIIPSAEYPRFVIQKHAATRLHYDLRLEHDGTFKSWAVTRGPSLNPRDKRLAVEVEDHPLEYGDFEGTIPKGEYGGGTVMLWDRGFWAPEGDNVDEALREGDLKFTLAGHKLKGSWVLVRMKRDRDGGKRNNWLLIKHRDGLEREADAASLEDTDRSVASGRTMAQIAAGKGRGPKPFMAAGGKAAKPAAVWHSKPKQDSKRQRAVAKLQIAAPTRSKPAGAAAAMPLFIEPQLCRSVTRPPDGTAWAHEIKFDGYRMQLRIEDGKAKLLTRKGLDWTEKFRAIADAAAALPDAIIDGEAVALDRQGAPNFSALQVALSEGRNEDILYFAFDLLFVDGEDLRSLPLSDRKQRLQRALSKLPVRSPIRYLEHVVGSGASVMASARKLNLEGIVSKRLDAPYRSDRRESWLKAKTRPGHEVVIGGWSGSITNLRSLLVGVRRSGKLVHTGRVGTGFNARNSKTLLSKLRTLAAEKSPFVGENAPRREKDVTWVKPELVAEIEFAGFTEDGNVRQASFKALREDKPASEVKAEMPADPADVEIASPGSKAMPRAPTGSRRPANAGNNVVLGVSISNPDKALWPKEGGHKAYTKLDLAHYLEQVGPWMIEHLKGRPCSVIRAPDGIHAERFFQRHGMLGMSKLVSLTKVEGDRKPYLQIDTVEGLIAMGQVAAVEFHPWNNQPGNPKLPGRLVFDLDPAPEVDFDAVIEAAKELRQRLEKLGLVTFCKTTGGKGLHVVTPLKVKDDGKLGWGEAKTFAQAVCTGMAGDSPDRYLINMAKKERTGRIFLDYLRNDRMSTAVAPLSPRARPGAPVSMPLNWNQVRAGLDPQRYTMRTVPALLARSTAWQDYCDSERPLEAAIRKLVGRGK
jgi:bifunctional non-homologous end joining protein LigD